MRCAGLQVQPTRATPQGYGEECSLVGGRNDARDCAANLRFCNSRGEAKSHRRRASDRRPCYKIGMTSCAFIGLGIMGQPMAGHLLAGGHSLVVHNRTKSKADDLIERGVNWADSPAAAVKDADVVFVCVTDTPDAQA